MHVILLHAVPYGIMRNNNDNNNNNNNNNNDNDKG